MGQKRLTALGVVQVKRKYVGKSGRWFGRWWVTSPTRYALLEIWTTGELQEFPVAVDG